MAPLDSTPLLEARNLRVSFPSPNGLINAVDGVSFSLAVGETLAVVGESGCGKSTVALALLKLVPPPGRIISGEIIFKGQDLLPMSERALRKVRGARMAMIFQEPAKALNPLFTVGDQIAEVVRAHQSVSKKEAWNRAIESMAAASISDPEARARSYPHQLSGGLQQRVMIAMALVCRPDVLIADEPTTALDVTIQAQILDLLIKLRQDLALSMIFISHDLGVVAEIAQRAAVMQRGRLVEVGGVRDIFKRPAHPYTKELLAGIQKLSIEH
jgi:ABC-type dipeptide/oligopeptide/nickel transport system ATPase component